jgi:hypothetical protein
MRIWTLALFFICVAGCTTQQPYRDATNSGRTFTDMQIDGAICQTVLPNPPNAKSQSLCPACAAVDSISAQIKRQRIFDNCMKAHGWEIAR